MQPNSIKIIKRNQRELLAAPQEANSELMTETQRQRVVFETITSWIEEQREAKQALHQRQSLLLRVLTG